MPRNKRYASFMLRLQRSENNAGSIWVSSIQSMKTGELRWFPNLEALITFLRGEFAEGEEDAEIVRQEAQGRGNTEKNEKDNQAPGSP